MIYHKLSSLKRDEQTHMAATIALKRGTTRMTIEDVAFPIRKDRAKLARLRYVRISRAIHNQYR